MGYDSEAPAPGGPELSSAHGQHGAQRADDAYRPGCLDGPLSVEMGSSREDAFGLNGRDVSKRLELKFDKQTSD